MKLPKLKTRLCKPLHKLREAYSVLKKRVCSFLYSDGFVLAPIPQDPCPSCGAELAQCIGLMSQKGWTIIGTVVKHKKGGCCDMVVSLKTQVLQAKHSQR